MTVELPDRGFVFWPVGCGDSTTVLVNDGVVLQVDIQHHESAEDDDEPYHPVVDTLVDEVLPVVDDEPYLAVFALTHPDKDHCKGFAELLDRCTIGEIWFTPRVIREFDTDEGLSDDAEAFCEEASRRIKAYGDGEVQSGDRIRIIGNDDILDEDDYADIPDECKSRPGEATTVLDGADVGDTFRAFFHAPFGDDSELDDRNRNSLAMQITLSDGDGRGKLMLFGDLDYPPLKRIFEYTDDVDDKAWDVLLAPHHCSKSAMYFQEDGDDEPVLKQDVLDLIEDAGGDEGWIVSSSTKVPASNESGDNPPHTIAKEHYEEIAPSGFLCTGDDENSDEPICFQIDSGGISLLSGKSDTGSSEAAESVKDARGGTAPVGTAVGFGKR